MKYIRLMGLFLRAGIQQETAYRWNFAISLVFALVNLVTAVAALGILFGQVDALRGWDYASTLALMGVYLLVSGLGSLCLRPSLESMAGMDGETWTGRFDFTLLRPVDLQFLASFRNWRPFAALDIVFGSIVLVRAAALSGGALTLERVGLFALALLAGFVLVYALLLTFTALVFWSPGFLFTWIFDAMFQLARYPVGIYPGWLRLLLTWAVPVGLITTLPAEAFSGRASLPAVLGSLGAAALALAASSLLFRAGVRRYSSASS